jgi:hypothetical protein
MTADYVVTVTADDDEIARLRQVAAAHLSLLLRGPRRGAAGDTVTPSAAYDAGLRLVEDPSA